MKFILLFLLTITLAFSNEKKIILGTYSQTNHASKALAKANHIIDTDSALKIFMDLNHLSVQIDKIEHYNVITVKTLFTNKELFYVLDKLHKYYPDLYVLPPYKGTIIHKSSLQTKVKKEKALPVVVKVIEPAKKIMKEKKIIPLEEPKVIVFHEKKELPEKKIVQVEEKPKVIVAETIPEVVEDDALLDKEIDDTYNKTNLFNYQIAITIIIAVILLLILINTIIKMRHSSKKEKYTPYPRDE